ncbi:MAG: hypothetical protein ACT4TC_25185 [Myxococcaceae bacterium]
MTTARSASRVQVLLGATLLLAAALTSCRDPSQAAGTSLLITEQHSELTISQLRVKVRPPEGEAKGPVTAPVPAGGPLESGQSLRLLLPDSWDGVEVAVEVEALHENVVVSRADVRVTVKLATQVEVPVRFGGGVVVLTDGGTVTLDGGSCASCDAKVSDGCASGQCSCGGQAACAAGQMCSGGVCVCNTTSCAGCCAGEVCMPGTSPDVCGAGGGTCNVCPQGQTCTGGVCSGCNATSCATGCCSGSTCNPQGLTACGTAGNACVGCKRQRADQCLNGQCLCGSNAECGEGQRCSGGQCICDGVSCPSGCCEGKVCKIPDLASCGANGASCKTCDRTKADRCSSGGSCRCGDDSACGAGQKCSGGRCVCDAATCPGCCDGSQCRDRSFTRCGIDGQTCSSCDLNTADRCSADGACLCGNSPACGAGQRCSGGQCICDGKSCSTGCCRGNVCFANGLNDSQSCGVGGVTCQSCTAPATCSNGACSGCNVNNCPNGCCLGEACVAPPLVNACGAGGQACKSCDLQRANACGSDGNCRCGGQAQCAPGLHCVTGQCACDATSCAGCCLNGTCEPGNTPQACGNGAQQCGACGVGADSCQNGECHCGSGPVCAAGQRCVNGNCGCDAASCPDGCCDGSVCTQPSATACGDKGSACKACSPTNSDRCNANGQCVCGAGARATACGPGQICSNGACICDGTSCNGCCDGNVCKPGNTRRDCGAGGNACVRCTPPTPVCGDNGQCKGLF